MNTKPQNARDLLEEVMRHIIGRAEAMLKDVGIEPGILVRRRSNQTIYRVICFEFGATFRWQGQVLDNVQIYGETLPTSGTTKGEFLLIGYAEDVDVIGPEHQS